MPSFEQRELNFASKSLPHVGSAMVSESMWIKLEKQTVLLISRLFYSILLLAQ